MQQYRSFAMRVLLLLIVETVIMHGGTLVKATKCYEELGCFDNGYPWSSLLRPVPEPASPKDVNTTFYLFYDSKAEPITLTTWPKISFERTPFNSSCETFFITHGFRDRVLDSWPEHVARAIVVKFQKCVNVIGVDWSGGAGNSFLDYFSAVSNTRIAGAEISRVIRYIIETLNVLRTSIHLIGHSLGAHICSYAANGAGGIFSITGLDCAQPLFEGSTDNRIYLDKSDACLVYAVHTDARPTIPFLGVGFVRQVGDIDYYVNGGVRQPGCSYPDFLPANANLLSFLRSPQIAVEMSSCRHARSHEYYLETIENDTCIMWGHQDAVSNSYFLRLMIGAVDTFPDTSSECSLDSCIPMGLNATKYPARGSFLTKTRDEPPYCFLEPVIDRSMAEAMRNQDAFDRRALCAAKRIRVD